MENTKTIRIAALDVFRAVTMFLMLFVNDIPGLKNIPHGLLHAAANEDMLGFSDIIFPGFLFAMGMAIPYAIDARYKKGDTTVQIIMHILKRTVILLIMGLFTVNIGDLNPEKTGLSYNVYVLLMALGFFLAWSVYPKSHDWKDKLFKFMQIVGILLLVYLWLTFKTKDGAGFTPQWWGILGLIGWTYLASAAIYLFTRDNLMYNAIAVAVIIMISLISAAGLFKGIALAEIFPSEATLYAFGMAGVWTGVFLKKYAGGERIRTFFIVMPALGIVSLIGALITHQFWIISKIQATPTWFFYCCAIFFPFFTLIYWLTDIQKKSHWFNLIKPAGTVTLTCYIIPYAWYSVQWMLGLKYPALLTSGLPGIIKSLVFSLIIIGIAWILMKLKVRLKI
ncbi:MAG: DUF5009 domain-containing protein [Tannerella sp.]|jgi:predicted acyltransferase|nr:DUF5009 domain-containing protein [Tannerella sp.]